MMRRYILHQTKYMHTYTLAEAVPKAIYLSTVSLLCFYSAVWMALDVFPDWELTAAAQRWVWILVLVTTAVYEIGIQALPRYRGLSRLLGAVPYGLIFYRYGKEYQIELEDGACAFGTQFLEKYNRQMRTSFTIWKGKEEYISMSLAFWCICIVMTLLVLVLITGRRSLLLIMPAAVLAGLLTVGFAPQWKGLALFFVAVMVVYAAEDDRRKKTMRVRTDVRQRAVHAWYTRWIPVVCLTGGSVILLLIGSAVFQMPALELMNQAPRVQEFQKNTERGLESAVKGYFTPFRENIHNQSPKYTGKEVMKVTASVKPEADVYMKGFYGTDYQNGTWVCRKEKFQEACAQEGIETEDAAVQLLQAPYDVFSKGTGWQVFMFTQEEAGYSEEPDDNDIIYTIEQNGLYNKYAYLPYAIDFEKDRSTESLVGDVTVQKGWGQKKFSFHGWNLPLDQNAVMRMQEEQEKKVFEWYDAFAKSAYLGLSGQVADLSRYLSVLEKENDTFNAKDNNGNRVYHMFSSMSAVAMEYVFQNWREQMKIYEGHNIQQNQVRISIAQLISLMLKEYQTYSLNLESVPADMDAVDFFLMNSHKGYCVHFASAAVLMLRQMGVPARYVSGYVARQNEFKYRSDTDVFEASVKDSSAHAWAEIYLNQIGWIPIDVTPGQSGDESAQNTADQENGAESDEAQAEQDDTHADETQSDTDADDTDTDDTDTDDTDTDDTNTDDTSTDDTKAESGTQGQAHGSKSIDWKGLLSKAAAAAGILIVFWLSCLAVRLAVCRYQDVLKNELKNGRYRRAVFRINRRIYRKLLLHGKIRHQNMTDADYGRLLEKSFTKIEGADWRRYMQIVKEAAFSRNELQREDAYFCYKIYKKL